jgi:phosphoribosylanthranilate isomerase
MFIKVCGMLDEKQISELSPFIDAAGFIFHAKSDRFCTKKVSSNGLIRVGVFVNKTIKEIKETIEEHNLTMIQLHGDESIEFCKAISEIPVIKAFGIDENFNFNSIKEYESHVDYFLFDTKTIHYGGSGKSFNWEILKNYKGETPFILSGGINPSSIEDIKHFNHPYFFGIDLNSGFEISPGNKNTPLLKQFIYESNNI